MSVMTTRPSRRRGTTSDVMPRVGPPVGWRVFRDVFEVDGNPVRDRDERLTRLFLGPIESAVPQAERTADEGARYNITLNTPGRLLLNEPGLPLTFLQSAMRPRFIFSIDKPDGGKVVPQIRGADSANGLHRQWRH